LGGLIIDYGKTVCFFFLYIFFIFAQNRKRILSKLKERQTLMLVLLLWLVEIFVCCNTSNCRKSHLPGQNRIAMRVSCEIRTLVVQVQHYCCRLRPDYLAKSIHNSSSRHRNLDQLLLALPLLALPLLALPLGLPSKLELFLDSKLNHYPIQFVDY
jgi:hypothetical protein